MNLLSFDIESCNGSNKGASMCSFGYCVSDDKFNILSQKDILINPMPKRFYTGRLDAIELAYPEEKFRKAPRFNVVYEIISKLFADNVLCVGFSIKNDISYINNACDEFGLNRLKFRYIDVQQLYRLVKNNDTDLGLGVIAEQYGINFVAHRSDEDARVTLEVLKRLCDETKKSVDELANEYQIVFGVQSDDENYPSYSIKEIDKKCSGKLSNKTKSILLEFFCKNAKPDNLVQNNRLQGKKICFSRQLQTKNLNVLRNVIQALLNVGATRVTDFTDCDYFVRKEVQLSNEEIIYQSENIEKDDIDSQGVVLNCRDQQIKKIDFNELLALIGNVPDVNVDNTQEYINYIRSGDRFVFGAGGTKKKEVPKTARNNEKKEMNYASEEVKTISLGDLIKAKLGI